MRGVAAVLGHGTGNEHPVGPTGCGRMLDGVPLARIVLAAGAGVG